jgi:hypothetical protein
MFLSNSAYYSILTPLIVRITPSPIGLIRCGRMATRCLHETVRHCLFISDNSVWPRSVLARSRLSLQPSGRHWQRHLQLSLDTQHSPHCSYPQLWHNTQACPGLSERSLELSCLTRLLWCYSRQKYGTRRAVIEDKILRRLTAGVSECEGRVLKAHKTRANKGAPHPTPA